MHTFVTTLALIPGFVAVASAQATSADWSAVEQALGRRGAAQPGGVMRFGFPRTDLRVTVAGVEIRPAFALGSWAAFVDVGAGHVLVMGDLVLTEDEVNPVLRRLQDGGVQQTALLGQTPKPKVPLWNGAAVRCANCLSIRSSTRSLTCSPP
jgi:hypothetical protein